MNIASLNRYPLSTWALVVTLTTIALSTIVIAVMGYVAINLAQSSYAYTLIGFINLFGYVMLFGSFGGLYFGINSLLKKEYRKKWYGVSTSLMFFSF